MDLKELESTIENMILQHDYPGYEARSLNLALPQAFVDAPARLYLEALGSKNIYVQLAALRWFQTKTGVAKNHASAIANKLNSPDAWVRLEAIRTIEVAKVPDENLIAKLSSLLKDDDQSVRTECAKALGVLVLNLKKTTPVKSLNNSMQRDENSIENKIILALRDASADTSHEVRRKAVKALRKLGAFS